MLTAKTLGADIELGNTLVGPRWHTNLEAAAKVLRESTRIRAFRGVSLGSAPFSSHGEGGRHWLPNGGCLYIDMSHLEICLPETASARAHAAALHAMLRIVRACRRQALQRLGPEEDLFVNAHLSDGTLETSWGAHLNVLVSQPFWEDLAHHKPHLLALFASFMAAAVPVFGQGFLKPDDSDGSPSCRYVTSARAHHLGELAGLPTTVPFRRNLVNLRDEGHADATRGRLHLIAFDTNLQPAAIFLRSGLTQLVLAALEGGTWFDPALLLDDPLAAVRAWSESFSPQTGTLAPVPARRPDGTALTLCQWHRRLLSGLGEVVQRGAIPAQIVPEAPAILDLWAETLDDLEHGYLDRLASRLDWALKWQILAEELPRCGGDLSQGTLRLLDQLYSHVDDGVGLFWTFWRQGLIDRCGIDDRAIGRLVTAGDPQTRSGLRGELVRRLGPWITGMDWSYIEVSRDSGGWWGSPKHRLELLDPSAPSSELLRELRRRFPRDGQLLAWLTQRDSLRGTAPSPVADFDSEPVCVNPKPGKQGV
jgi:proteasome accessory factor A